MKDKNSCVTLAWCTVFDCDYSKATRYLEKYGKTYRKGMLFSQIENAFSGVQKNKCVRGPYSRKNKITVGKFIKQHPTGRFFVVVRGHALSIIDGEIIDWNEKGLRRQVISAWRVYLTEE